MVLVLLVLIVAEKPSGKSDDDGIDDDDDDAVADEVRSDDLRALHRAMAAVNRKGVA